MSKQILRRKLLTQRDSIEAAQKKQWDAAINEALRRHEWFLQAQMIFAYYPINSEPDILPALEYALRQKKQIALPRCDTQTRSMQFYPVQSLHSLPVGAYGIPAPEGEEYIPAKHAQLVIVPGISFDDAGYRLGYGGGYYDRFFARYSGLRTLGVCYKKMMQAQLPKDEKDIAVLSVLTEQRGETR